MTKQDRIYRRILILILLVVISISYSKIQVYAESSVLDMNKKGSITILLKDKDKILTEGEFTLYQIADIVEIDGNLKFQYTNGFENCGISLENLDESKLAEEFEKKISKHSYKTVQNVNEKGKIEFADLQMGLYLLVQTKEISGYQKINSFLVSVPIKEGNKWNYNINAVPKMGIVTSIDIETPSRPADSIPATLPQTGQLKWPIPILSIMGIVLFMTGWYCTRRNVHAI